MTELLTCPFCGGEARIFHFSSAIRDEVWRAVCDKPFCAQGPDGYTEAEAIEAWNTRVGLTTRNISSKLGNDEFTCEECLARVFGCKGEWFDEHWNYHKFSFCPNCGAKVVDE